MPSAILTGATGILGRSTLHELISSDSPNWSTIHALSHRQPPPLPSLAEDSGAAPAKRPKIHHSKIDLLSPPETIAMQLQARDVKAEYLFFSAYLQRGDEGEMERVNGDMLRNLLTALAFTGAERYLKRVILTTGAKHYGVHLGPVKCPMEETDVWIEGRGRPPNFYYRQQRILAEMSGNSKEKVGRDRSAGTCGGGGGGGGGWDWVVTYPNDVIGVARDNFMNLTTAIGIYATICKELGEGFIFPGSRDFYTRFDSFTSSRQHAKFCVWAALEPRAGGEAFNVVNGDVTSWQVLWPKLAKRFGVKVPRDQFEGEDEKVVSLSENPPLREYEAEMGLEKGRVKRGEVRMRVDLVAWAQRTEVREAWDRIVQRDGGQGDALVKATWFFLNFVLGRNYDVVISMAKARRFGFHDSVDSWDELSGCLDQLVADGVLPR